MSTFNDRITAAGAPALPANEAYVVEVIPQGVGITLIVDVLRTETVDGVATKELLASVEHKMSIWSTEALLTLVKRAHAIAHPDRALAPSVRELVYGAQ